jgi:hypothetical protein
VIPDRLVHAYPRFRNCPPILASQVVTSEYPYWMAQAVRAALVTRAAELGYRKVDRSITNVDTFLGGIPEAVVDSDRLLSDADLAHLDDAGRVACRTRAAAEYRRDATRWLKGQTGGFRQAVMFADDEGPTSIVGWLYDATPDSIAARFEDHALIAGAFGLDATLRRPFWYVISHSFAFELFRPGKSILESWDVALCGPEVAPFPEELV